MDSKTRDYMKERISKYDGLSSQIKKYSETADLCRKRAGEEKATAILYIKGNYHEAPACILEDIAGLIDKEIARLEALQEAI